MLHATLRVARVSAAATQSRQRVSHPSAATSGRMDFKALHVPTRLAPDPRPPPGASSKISAPHPVPPAPAPRDRPEPHRPTAPVAATYPHAQPAAGNTRVTRRALPTRPAIAAPGRTLRPWPPPPLDSTQPP